MKTTAPFRFKQFSVVQHVNHQKVGTDSVLLGAWVDGSYEQILDIGTGTGILALMMAQKNLHAEIVGIEPDSVQCVEASINFTNSPFKNRLKATEQSLQNFQSDKKFDLIICNPPYFENSTPNINEGKTRVRHTINLPVDVLYSKANSLLSHTGEMALIIPFESEKNHLECAALQSLFPKKILHTIKENGTQVRSLIHYSRKKETCTMSTMLVKLSNNTYSTAYISLTRDFYWKDLSAEI